jgi:carbon-monoxide dehydrogenase medium subunit
MKSAPFTYHAPRSISEAIDLLGRLENARVLGGGQSLMPMMNLRVASLDHLIDLGRITELVGIAEDETSISIGAMTTQRAIEKSALIRANCPLLSYAIDCVGHQQTRNRGTIGGSLCHLDPGAELPVAALALDATLTIAGPRGERSLRFADFALGYLSVALEPDEILTRIAVPKARARETSAFLEFNRRPADFAIVSVAARLTLGDGGGITKAIVAVGGVGEVPRRLDDVESALANQVAGAGLFETAAQNVRTMACDGDDLYPAGFRRDVCETLVKRALRQALARAEVDAHV